MTPETIGNLVINSVATFFTILVAFTLQIEQNLLSLFEYKLSF